MTIDVLNADGYLAICERAARGEIRVLDVEPPACARGLWAVAYEPAKPADEDESVAMAI